MPKGSPRSKYQPSFAKQAEKLCRLGATDIEVADFFEVARMTLWSWCQQHQELADAMKAGKAAADERVERSLYARATGYTHDAVKIFPPKTAKAKPVIVPYREHVPPDTTACIFWLKNRRPEAWKDRREHEISGSVNYVAEMPAVAEDADAWAKQHAPPTKLQ